MSKTLQTGFVRQLLLTAVPVLGLLGMVNMSCVPPEMGSLDNREEVGRQERGRDPGSYWVDNSGRQYNPETGEYEEADWTYYLYYTDVILSPDGLNLLAMVPKPGPNQGWSNPGMVLVVQPLPLGMPRIFTEVQDLQRLNFSPSGDYAFALTKGDRKLHTINLRTFALERTVDVIFNYTVVDVTPDGKHVVLSNLPTSEWEEAYGYNGLNQSCNVGGAENLCRFGIFNVAAGTMKHGSLSQRIRDLDFSSYNSDLILTTSRWVDAGEEYLPETTMHFVDAATAEVVDTASFPNCADEVVIDAQRDLALLSPIACTPPPHPNDPAPPANKDPISVVDLKTREFVANLPGFGPVVLADNGNMAVGFTRQDALEEEWNYFEQETPFGLIFVDLDTFDYKIVNYGDEAPAYTVSPDGRRLLLYVDGHRWVKGADGTWHWTSSNKGLTQLDLETGDWEQLTDSATTLDRYVWTGDGQHMYFLSGAQLRRYDAAEGAVEEMLIYGTPDNINLRPQGDFLVLGESDRPVYYTFDLDDFSAKVFYLDKAL